MFETLHEHKHVVVFEFLFFWWWFVFEINKIVFKKWSIVYFFTTLFLNVANQALDFFVI